MMLKNCFKSKKIKNNNKPENKKKDELIRRNSTHKFVSTDDNVWKNESVKTIESVDIEIPLKIVKTLQALNKKFSDVEFSILCKTKYVDDKFIVDENDIFIPEQKVTSAGVDYKEDNSQYNTVIHKHPNGCKNFSNTDREYINSNFDFSYLWVDNKLEKGLMRIKTEYGYVQVNVKFNVHEENLDVYLPEGYEEKIIRGAGGIVSAHYMHGNWNGGWNGGWQGNVYYGNNQKYNNRTENFFGKKSELNDIKNDAEKLNKAIEEELDLMGIEGTILDPNMVDLIGDSSDRDIEFFPDFDSNNKEHSRSHVDAVGELDFEFSKCISAFADDETDLSQRGGV